MATRLTRYLPADAGSPGAARIFVRAQLDGLPMHVGDVVADAVLVVSELVANSVQAGCGACEIEVSVSPIQIDIVVRDDAGGWPVAQVPGDGAVSGRGLLLVSALTRSWTVQPWAAGGKQVSAVLSLRPPPGGPEIAAGPQLPG